MVKLEFNGGWILIRKSSREKGYISVALFVYAKFYKKIEIKVSNVIPEMANAFDMRQRQHGYNHFKEERPIGSFPLKSGSDVKQIS